MAKGDNKKGGKSSQGPRKAVTSDPRFARVHNDPRFNMPKRRDMKVTIDERFKTRMADEEDFKRKTVVDKYGRKVAKDSSEKELKKYYNMDDDEDKEEDKKDSEEGSESGSEADSESSDSDAEAEAETAAKKKNLSKPAKKEIEVASASDDEDDSESESESSEEEGLSGYSRARGEDSDVSESSDDASSEEEVEEEELLIEQEEVAQGDETKSIAVVNLDWDNVRAVDLMATFSSFVPSRGRIESVTIFPSEYGKMRMAQEDIQGPAPELFATNNTKKKSRDDEELTTKDLIEEDKGEEVDSKTLRKYQLQRLRYYYAIVKCDSIATARNIYDSCDGTEFEATANFFDLRYVPDDMDFDDEPHDKCTLVPADYKPNYFVTDALQHSKVRLTWDETPAERIKLASKAFSRREIDDMDFKAYLASDSDGSGSEDQEDMKSKYKSLLSNSEYGSLLEGDDKDDVDMEITFTPGLDGDKLPSDSESEKEETTLEKYKRKEKERRKERMEAWKAKNEEAVDDKKTKNKKGKKNATPTAEQAKQTAELELLMMEDGEKDKVEHFDMKEILKAEKKAKRNKGKKSKKDDEPAVSGMDFEVDVKDDRFAGLYDSHEFAIDPNQPQFKKTAGMEKLLEERRKRTLSKPSTDSKAASTEAPAESSAPKATKSKSAYAKEVFSAAQKRKHDGDQSIQDLIAKVKRRTKK